MSMRSHSPLRPISSHQHPDIFEQGLALNDEDIDLYEDTDERHRADNEYGKGPDTNRPGLAARRKSYSERRKREKHTIKYCAESSYL